PEKFRLALVVAPQMDKRILIGEPLEVQRDAHAKRGGRPEKAEEFHGQATRQPRLVAARRYSAAAATGRMPVAARRSRADEEAGRSARRRRGALADRGAPTLLVQADVAGRQRPQIGGALQIDEVDFGAG